MENYYYNHTSHMYEQDAMVYTLGVLNTLSHVHDTIEIGCVLQGRLQISINSQDYLIQEGGMFLVNTMETHRYQVEGEYCICTFFSLKRSLYQQVFPKNRQYNLHFVIEKPDPSCDLSKKIRTMFLAMNHNIVLHDDSYNLVNQTCILYSLCLINKIAKKSTVETYFPKEINESSKDITSYLMENYKKNISIKNLAEHIHLSPDYTAHLFKSIFGTSLKQYVNYIRVSQAQQLLLSSKDNTITEIFLDCGFSNHASFIRAFKKFSNATPSEYIAIHRKGIRNIMNDLQTDNSLKQKIETPTQKNPYSFPMLHNKPISHGKYTTFSGTYIDLSPEFIAEHLKQTYQRFVQDDIIDTCLYEKFLF